MRTVSFWSVALAAASGVWCQASEPASRVNVVRVPISGSVIKAQAGADGMIHLLIDAEDGPVYVKSREGGATFSEPMAIVDAASQKPGLKFSGWDMAVGWARARRDGKQCMETETAGRRVESLLRQPCARREGFFAGPESKSKTERRILPCGQ